MLQLTLIGYALSFWNTISGKPEPVTLRDYPKFYQNMIVRQAAKEAGKKQNAIIAEYKAQDTTRS